MKQNDALREHLINLLDWESAHVGFAAAVAGIPSELRGVQPEGLPHSPWQLLEHLRICQLDILEFCRNPAYQEPPMEDYWPKTSAPPNPEAWENSISSFLQDLEAMKKVAADPKLDLFATIPHGNGQTYLREVLLVADHNAYHVGQIVAVRRLLGCW